MNAAIPTSPQPRRQLSDWVNLIRHEEMPVFDNTVQKVLKLSANDMASASELAQVVLQDASMTTRVLKLVNSVHYTPYNLTGGASTVSRAIVVLGFNAVRNICLTVTLIDELVKGQTRTRLLRELAHAIHASVQARGLALDRRDSSPEEVFIATMLHRIGELAFWCHSGESGDTLERQLRQPGAEPLAVQEAILGFRLDHLNRELAREWSLNGLLLDAIAHPGNQDPRIQSVVLGDRIARCAEDKGWQSPEMLQLIRKAASLTGGAVKELPAQLLQRARTACEMATDFGARQVATYIARTIPGTRESELLPEPEPEPAAAPAFMQPDGKLQLRVLRELSLLLEEGRLDFNLIMEMVLEGIYRGVGMDRVLFALLTPDKQVLRGKYALGEDRAGFLTAFQFSRASGPTHILFQVLDRRQPAFFDPKKPGDLAKEIPAGFTQFLGNVPFMLAPIVVGTQAIGVLHADRGPSGRPLDEDDFESFKHFAQQANLTLTVAASRRRSGGTAT